MGGRTRTASISVVAAQSRSAGGVRPVVTGLRGRRRQWTADSDAPLRRRRHRLAGQPAHRLGSGGAGARAEHDQQHDLRPTVRDQGPGPGVRPAARHRRHRCRRYRGQLRLRLGHRHRGGEMAAQPGPGLAGRRHRMRGHRPQRRQHGHRRLRRGDRLRLSDHEGRRRTRRAASQLVPPRGRGRIRSGARRLAGEDRRHAVQRPGAPVPAVRRESAAGTVADGRPRPHGVRLDVRPRPLRRLGGRRAHRHPDDQRVVRRGRRHQQRGRYLAGGRWPGLGRSRPHFPDHRQRGDRSGRTRQQPSAAAVRVGRTARRRGRRHHLREGLLQPGQRRPARPQRPGPRLGRPGRATRAVLRHRHHAEPDGPDRQGRPVVPSRPGPPGRQEPEGRWRRRRAPGDRPIPRRLGTSRGVRRRGRSRVRRAEQRQHAGLRVRSRRIAPAGVVAGREQLGKLRLQLRIADRHLGRHHAGHRRGVGDQCGRPVRRQRPAVRLRRDTGDRSPHAAALVPDRHRREVLHAGLGRWAGLRRNARRVRLRLRATHHRRAAIHPGALRRRARLADRHGHGHRDRRPHRHRHRHQHHRATVRGDRAGASGQP